ncbi:MAG: carbohydrate ABC transporter permease [Trueperaceae bacterium]
MNAASSARRRRDIRRGLVTHGVLIAILAVLLFPVYVMIKTSLTPFADILSFPPTWLPEPFTLANYVEVFTGQYRFGQAYLNSVIIAVSTALLAVVFGFTGAYGLSRFRFRGRTPLLFVALATQMFSPVVLVVSIYQIVQGVGMLNRLSTVILAQSALAVPIALWLLHGYLAGIPEDLEEAAMIDGCSRLTSLRYIILPLAGPGIAMAAIYAFIHAWNQLLFPLALLNDASLFPIPLALTRFAGQNVVYWNLMMAAGVLATVPVALLFSAVQGVFVRGITAGAVKG